MQRPLESHHTRPEVRGEGPRLVSSSDDPPNLNVSETPSREKALLTLAGLMTTIILLWLRYDLYLTSNEGFEFLRYFENYSSGPMRVGTICFVFLALHLIRLYLGVNFLDHDITLRASAKAEDFARKDSIEIVFRAWLISLTTLTPFVLSNSDYRGTCRLLLLQAFLLMFYNLLYGRLLYHEDKQWTSNLFILAADFLFLFAALGFALTHQQSGLADSSEFWMTLLLGAYLIIFLLEMVVHYFRPLLELFRQVAFAKDSH